MEGAVTAQTAAPDTKVIDQVRLAVIQNALISLTREMGTIMERASYSSILNEGKDFSCAVFNRDGELVAEGEFVLVHLAAMHEAVQVLIQHFGDRWQPGDIAFHNDPYEGGSHLPDINLLRPVFSNGEVIAYVSTRAHFPDSGGAVPGGLSGEARNLFEEGIAIPPLLLARGDVLDEQLIAFWTRNIRASHQLRADLMAEVASVRIGEKAFLELCERFGHQAVVEVLDEIPRYGEAVMRSRIVAKLTGENEYFDFMDDAGPDSKPVRIHLKVRVHGSDIEFDYTDSDPQVPCPINAPPAVVKSATYGAMKCMIIPDLPLNSGMFRPMRILTRPGTVTHPLAPAPVAAGNTNTSQRIFDICLACIGEMMPGQAGGMAGSYSANSDMGIGGRDERTGDEFVLYMMPVGGIGARPDRDGESALIGYMGNCSSQPVEVWESMYPLRVTQYRLRPDSAGPGRRRGGLGLCVSYQALQDGIEFSVFTERQRLAPHGLELGQPALSGLYAIQRGETRILIPTKTSGLWLQAGDTVDSFTGGGGGYGDPFTRELELVAKDVREGLVSVATAATEYGVVVTPDGVVDVEASEQLRQAHAQQDERPILRLTIAEIDDRTSRSVVLGEETASKASITDQQVLYCFSPRCAVYARAAVRPGSTVVISAPVARALDLMQGDEIALRPLSTHWTPYRTDEIRRQFSVTRLHKGDDQDD
jgi:N-methylhydantoinase B